ncbi:MAG: adenylate/guanylate cyclase domain-containing protein [Bacteroidota bacterium]
MKQLPTIPYREWIYIIAAWVFIMYFYGFIAFWGMSEYLQEGTVTNYMATWPAHMEMVLGGVFFGLLFAAVNTATDRSPFRRKSLGYIIAVRSVLYVVAWFSVLIGTAFLYGALEIVPWSTLEEIKDFPPLYLISLFAYFALFSILLNFVLQVSRKFGPGNLSKLITGKYQNPKEEERIFLFLDLKGSTTIAEQLGHKAYSRFLRDCYHDLTDVVLANRAEIYQYVGDEVVLSWGVQEGLDDLSCLKTFFAYEEKLQDRESYYRQRYATSPEFKGGMDMGIVTAAEIGDIKREIAYHGDVLNTASRIQGQCKVFEKSLLVSGNLARNLTRMNGFVKNLVGELELRGKKKAVAVYSIGIRTN